jgi:hypothetical protein
MMRRNSGSATNSGDGVDEGKDLIKGNGGILSSHLYAADNKEANEDESSIMDEHSLPSYLNSDSSHCETALIHEGCFAHINAHSDNETASNINGNIDTEISLSPKNDWFVKNSTYFSAVNHQRILSPTTSTATAAKMSFNYSATDSKDETSLHPNQNPLSPRGSRILIIGSIAGEAPGPGNSNTYIYSLLGSKVIYIYDYHYC